MYVCVCHGIRCRDVRQAAQSGAKKASEVFRSCGAKPQCGKCVATMTDMLREAAPEEFAYGCAAE